MYCFQFRKVSISLGNTTSIYLTRLSIFFCVGEYYCVFTFSHRFATKI